MTGGIDPQLQSHKDRAVQLAASIQNTKDIIAGNFEFIISKKNFQKKNFSKIFKFFFLATKIRLEHETEGRNKVEARLRRVRSEMTRAKIKQNRSYRNKAIRKA